MTNLTDTERLSLRWLAKQERPSWGGHLDRKELPCESMCGLIENKLIESVAIRWQGALCHGYVITALGKRAAA